MIGNRWYGIYLEDSDNNSVFRNNIISNEYGVYLSLSSSVLGEIKKYNARFI